MLRHAGSTSDVVFVEKLSLRELAVGFAPKKGANVTCHMENDAGGGMIFSAVTPDHMVIEQQYW